MASKQLGPFGQLLHDPRLWRLNRPSVAGGVATGLFCMFIPPVGHTLVAAGIAIWLRVNLPIAVALVWLNNPLTIPPLYYLAYRVGASILDHPPLEGDVAFWLDSHHWLDILAPFMLGNLVCGTVCAILGYSAVQSLWRWRLRRQIAERRERLQRMLASRTSTPSSNRHT